MLGQRVREYNICKHLCHVCTHQYDIGHDDDDCDDNDDDDDDVCTHQYDIGLNDDDASDENDDFSVKAFLSCFYF